MAAFDASSTAQSAFSSSLTFSHTCSGADRVLFVAVNTGSGVTYNGVSMTAVETGDADKRLYALVAPASGTHDVVVSLPSPAAILAVAASYTGVDQVSPYDGVQASATGDTSPSVTVTSSTGNLVVGMSAVGDIGGLALQTAGAGQTSRGSLAEGQQYLILSDEAGAASTTHSYTRASGFFYSQRIVAVNVLAADEGPPPPASIPAMGRFRTAMPR
jgi:hypothetical protein